MAIVLNSGIYYIFQWFKPNSIKLPNDIWHNIYINLTFCFNDNNVTWLIDDHIGWKIKNFLQPWIVTEHPKEFVNFAVTLVGSVIKQWRLFTSSRSLRILLSPRSGTSLSILRYARMTTDCFLVYSPIDRCRSFHPPPFVDILAQYSFQAV